MSADDFLKVQRVSRDVWLPWVMFRHYARRKPHTVMHAFGLFNGLDCLGVVTYSLTTSPQIARSVVNERWRHLVLELSRLSLDSEAPPNSASILVGRSLRMLPSPLIIVSYSDTSIGHVGYVYQATNFDYCGVGPGTHHIRLSSGEEIHPRSITASGVSTAPKRWAIENGHQVVETSGKHRYMKVLGSPRQRRAIYKDVLWSKQPYPKGDTVRQAVDDFHPTQSAMF